MRKPSKPHSLPFYTETLALALVLGAVCAVLAQVFALSLNTSRRARRLNDAVQLCRNTVEACEAAGAPPESSRVDYYTDDLTPCDPANAVYTVTLTAEDRPTDAGTLTALTVSAAEDEEELYTLSTEFYHYNA